MNRSDDAHGKRPSRGAGRRDASRGGSGRYAQGRNVSSGGQYPSARSYPGQSYRGSSEDYREARKSATSNQRRPRSQTSSSSSGRAARASIPAQDRQVSRGSLDARTSGIGSEPRTRRSRGSDAAKDQRRDARPIEHKSDPIASRTDRTKGAARHAHAKQKGRLAKKATLVENKRSRSRRRNVAIVIISICAILVIAMAVGVYAFFHTTDSNLDLGDSNATDALVTAKADSPYFVLCVADLDDPSTKVVETESRGYMLVRVDAANKQLTYITIPSIIDCRMSDGLDHPLYEARDVGGDAELVRAISGLCDIEINHFIATNSAHMVNMVDMLGGVNLSVSEEIDDPHAGTEVIFAGDQTLNGSQVLTYLRATNISGGFDTTVANRVGFTMDVLDAAISSSGLDLASLVGDASLYIDTDISTSELLSMGDALRPADAIKVYSCIVPYYETRGSSTDDVVFKISSKSWETIRDLVVSGQDPNQTDESISNVVPGEVSVEVRNGTQMTGAGARLGEILQGFGYQVVGVGNVTDATTYPETLIIYTDSAYEGAAKAIASQIGSGRVVNGGDYYSSPAGVIAIIGLDYMPAV